MQKSFLRAVRLVAATAVLVFAPAVLLTTPVHAQGAAIGNLLTGASDNALDKLAQPGAYFADKAVRILLPGPIQKASKLLKFTGKGDLAKDLTKSMNEVASLAAKEAKPIFREAISGLNLKDGVGAATKKSGVTEYLRESSEGSLSQKIRPLVSKAMGDTGTFDQLDKLSSVPVIGKLGFSSDNMTDHVTKKAMDGIFKYMAAEENALRKNPLKSLGGLLGISK